MDRGNIDKIAHTPEDRLLLAKVWDKINTGIQRNIPASTCFLSPRELHMCRYLFMDVPGLVEFGGYCDAERRMLVYLPDYMEPEQLYEADSPVVCLRAVYFEQDTLSHRDFLGALMGCGIARETVGDICVAAGCCDFFVMDTVASYILQNFTEAGRAKVKMKTVSLSDVHVPEPEIQQIRDTLASLRLDSVVSAGFRIGRNLASSLISFGKAAINGLPCEKPDRAVSQGDKISLRGYGKIRLTAVGGRTKKGRISVIIDRYV